MLDLASLKALGASEQMASGSVPVVPRRILLVDGDGLCYYCAGNDETEAGEARSNLISKVQGAARQVGAERVIVLVTQSGSHKGHRYAVARAKPYQAQRGNSRRPKNWGALRDYLTQAETLRPFEVHSTAVAEADDLFGWYAYNYPEDVVIYTQDKDMRMLPGKHLDWVSHRVHTVEFGMALNRERERMFNLVVHNSEFNDKQYGPAWFWLQMLHGDTADNIPGLPKHKTIDAKGNPALKPVGEVTAFKLLDDENEAEFHLKVAELYKGYYGERWLVEMLEQAVLLWMRREPGKWDDCLDAGGPMACFNDGSEFFLKAYAEIERRVREADIINATPQDD